MKRKFTKYPNEYVSASSDIDGCEYWEVLWGSGFYWLNDVILKVESNPYHPWYEQAIFDTMLNYADDYRIIGRSCGDFSEYNEDDEGNLVNTETGDEIGYDEYVSYDSGYFIHFGEFRIEKLTEEDAQHKIAEGNVTFIDTTI